MSTFRFRRGGRLGFSVPEVLVAGSIATLLATSAASTFIWSMKVCMRGRQYCWAVTETREAKDNVIAYIRNACAIVAISDSGDWVDLRMPDNTVSRFAYRKPAGASGAGQLCFTRNVAHTNTPVVVVTRGLTKVMTPPVRNVFEQTGPTSLRIAFRLTEPLTPGNCPVEIDSGVQLRNTSL